MILLLDLPQPVHGMSSVNLAVVQNAKSSGIKLSIINTVPSYAARFFNTNSWLFFKMVHSVFCFFYFLFMSLFNFKKVVYRPINGGFGQLFDMFYFIICRIFFNKIYIHHHSFNYLNNRSRFFWFLNKIAGLNSKHIVLGKKMGEKLKSIYGVSDDNIIILSNLAFFDVSEDAVIEKDRTVKLGHLANLCFEKGVDVFIDVCNGLNELNFDFEAIIAGPFLDNKTEELVVSVVKDNVNIKYIGSVYGDDKRDFYKNIDCFIFPSKYKNEAEPLVLFEAAEQSNFLIGSQRGCMEDVINSLGGITFPEDEDLSNNILNYIVEMHSKLIFENQARAKRKESFIQEIVKAKKSLLILLDEMNK